jgi:hypothetical protein
MHFLSDYGSTSLVKLIKFFSFLNYTQSVGLLGWGINPLQGHYLHTEQHKQKKHIDIHALRRIQTQDPSVQEEEDCSCLTPRGHCDWTCALSDALNTEGIKNKTYIPGSWAKMTSADTVVVNMSRNTRKSSYCCKVSEG